MTRPDWLVARPIAHRGLHAAARGVIENSRAAAQAAIARRFAIECDIVLSSDEEAFVFHDDRLDRLTGTTGSVWGEPARALAETRLIGSTETLPSLSEFLGLIGGAVPLICEIKSRFDGDFRLADRAIAVAESYAGPLAFKSFDPEIVAHLRARRIGRPIGLVAEASYGDPCFAAMSPAQKQGATAWLHIGETRPDFLSWSVEDLPHPVPTLLRALDAAPVMVWTVRTPAQKALARAFADQIVFEGDPE